MKRRDLIVSGAAAIGLGACTTRSKFKTYNGPEVRYVVVHKHIRKMFLYGHERLLQQYKISLGFAPIGDKYYEGDGKTPEGIYTIDRRNPNSEFHLSLGISYPNQQDIAQAAAIGKPPGGNIFIHGQSNSFRKRNGDWTWGCIAVTNREIEDIYAMVRNGTPIQIRA